MNLHVETYGSGAPLLFIHGWGMHGGMWGGLAEKLAERYCVHVVDLPGHGYSHAVGWGEDDAGPLESMVSILNTQFSEPLTLCGWSLGGQIAMRWAQREPQKIKRLVLISSTPCFVNRNNWSCAMATETLAGFADALTENYAQTLRRFLALQVRGSDNERELLASLRSALFNRGEPSLRALQAGLEILRDVDLRADLSRITQPTLVIAGERDTLTPSQASQYMAEQLADARLAMINGAAHAPFLSHPEIFVDQLKSFLHERI